jgi:hypothetical protein
MIDIGRIRIEGLIQSWPLVSIIDTNLSHLRRSGHSRIEVEWISIELRILHILGLETQAGNT